MTEYDSEAELDTRKLVLRHNRKNKKSGGFQSMGLGREVFRGILKKGYKVPTPIQRKTIPVILEGRDVVAMARTGSGKTACFLIPLFEKLKARMAASGARALILSPTRELALQTLKFFRELSKFTGLRSMCVLGGDSMEKQFAAIHDNPDVIIATPGRFVHLCVEMSLKLTNIEYVVFDEADRLFEMGFGEQLREILGRLPDNRQTVLFSATLPKLLVDFAKAGLNDPTLIRLDVETKIPDTLKLAFFHCRSEGKPAALLHLLQEVIPYDQQTIVFLATRHHVEFIHVLLDLAGISNTFIYSQLDSAARKINTAKFQTRRCRTLLVTDLAARGIDIPLLDNVINYNFPAKSKLFIHRVGRVARAGRSGIAYSFVAGDELAYYIDLQLFLGNPLKFVDSDTKDWHNVLGRVPQAIHDEYADHIRHWFDNSVELTNLKKVSENGYIQYLKSRPPASVESAKRVKEIKEEKIGIHPVLGIETSAIEMERNNLLEQMKSFRPPSTIFEIGNTSKNTSAKSIMAVKRNRHGGVIDRFHSSRKQSEKLEMEKSEDNSNTTTVLEESSQDDILSAFDTIVQPKKVKEVRLMKPKKKRLRRVAEKDEENYISYRAKDFHTEAGYSMMNSFEAQASGAVLDLTGDDDQSLRKKKSLMRWDVKTKKYVRADQDEKKKIKTESGVWIPASYKSDRYKKWRERSKVTHHQDQEDDEEQPGRRRKHFNFGAMPENHPAMQKAKNAVPAHRKGPRSEIKRPEQILKQRKLDEKKKLKNSKRKKRGNRK